MNIVNTNLKKAIALNTFKGLKNFYSAHDLQELTNAPNADIAPYFMAVDIAFSAANGDEMAAAEILDYIADNDGDVNAAHIRRDFFNV